MAESSVNRVTLLGRLGKDAETRYTQSGIAATNFSMATSRRVKRGDDWEEETDWHNVVVWRKEKLAEYLKKGARVLVEGFLRTKSWEDRNGNKRSTIEVTAQNVILLSESGGTGSQKPKQETEDYGDDVPF